MCFQFRSTPRGRLPNETRPRIGFSSKCYILTTKWPKWHFVEKRIAGLVSLGGLRIPRWILNFGPARRADPKFKNQRRDSSPRIVKLKRKSFSHRGHRRWTRWLKFFISVFNSCLEKPTPPNRPFSWLEDSIFSHVSLQAIFSG